MQSPRPGLSTAGVCIRNLRQGGVRGPSMIGQCGLAKISNELNTSRKRLARCFRDGPGVQRAETGRAGKPYLGAFLQFGSEIQVVREPPQSSVMQSVAVRALDWPTHSSCDPTRGCDDTNNKFDAIELRRRLRMCKSETQKTCPVGRRNASALRGWTILRGGGNFSSPQAIHPLATGRHLRPAPCTFSFA